MGKSILLLVGGLTIIIGIITSGNEKRIEILPELNSDYFNELQARNISKSLIDNAIELMKKDENWQGAIQSDSNYSGQGSLSSYTMASQTLPLNHSVDSWDQYKMLLYSTGSYENDGARYQVTTEVLMRQDSYSKYSYLTESELSASGSNIWFWDKDELWGPIHTNGTFKMSGEPTFNGLTTSPNMWDPHPTNPTNPTFNGGSNFFAPKKNAPSSYELAKLTSAAASSGLTFSNQIEVEFYEFDSEGYANIREYSSGSWSNWNSHKLSSSSNIISTSGRIDVSGTVKGSVTLHSETIIEIDGDLVYSTNPLIDSTSTDLLGLVSEGDVRIDKYAHSANGSTDLNIHATIMALNTSFYVEDYSSGGNRGNLNLVGGIVQKNRGAVGTFSGTSIVSGYTKNYQYDTRLRTQIPPEFPRESIFSILYWKDKTKKMES